MTEVMGLLTGTSRCRMFICGSADMARDVVGALQEMKTTVSGVDDAQAVSWIQQLRRSKQLMEEVWG